MVIPYYRLMQSLPARPQSSTVIMESSLVKVLDESHFASMKDHRESAGHQHGDYSLHPASLIRLFSGQQCLWCWQYWSNSDGEKSDEAEGYHVLRSRLRLIWPDLFFKGYFKSFTAAKKLGFE